MQTAAYAQISANLSSGGGMKVGYTNGLCDSSILGALRYLDGDGLEYCDGTNWISVANGANKGPGSGQPNISAKFNESVRLGNVTTCASAADNGVVRYKSGSGIEFCYNNSWRDPKGQIAGKKVFITPSFTGGNLRDIADTLTGNWPADGVAGAHAICNYYASLSNLQGTYKAWVATATANAPLVNHTQSAEPYVKVNGTVVANNWSDLIDGNLASPIDVQADGTVVTGAQKVWTNVSSGAVLKSSVSTQFCGGWAATSNNGYHGLSNSTTGTWSDSAQVACTSTLMRLYCFQQ